MSFALLAVPGAFALLMLVRLRLSAPDPAAYDPTVAVSEAKRLRLGRGLPRTFWVYAAFSAATMFGFATWGVLAYHLVARDVVSEGMVPVMYAAAMGAAAVTAVYATQHPAADDALPAAAGATIAQIVIVAKRDHAADHHR